MPRFDVTSTPVAGNGDPSRTAPVSTTPAGVLRLGYVPSLDGLRAFAVTAVVGMHSGLPFFGGGDVGVDIFFVLSGFLITTLILEEQERFGRLDLKRFWIRRFLRLTPPLIVMITVVTALRYAYSIDTKFAAQEAAFAASYTTNLRTALAGGYGQQSILYLAHTWSLAIEEQFYLVWPLLLIWATSISRRRILQVLGLTYPIIALAGRTMAVSTGHPDLMQFPLLRFEGFGVGLAAAFLFRNRSTRHHTRLFGGWIGACAFATLLVEVILGDHWRDQFAAVPFVDVEVYVAGALLLSMLSSETWLGRLFSLRPVVVVGRLSYSIYLWHFPVFAYFSRHRVPARPLPLLASAKLGFAGAAALGSFLLVERPLESARNRYRPRKPDSFTDPAPEHQIQGIRL